MWGMAARRPAWKAPGEKRVTLGSAAMFKSVLGTVMGVGCLALAAAPAAANIVTFTDIPSLAIDAPPWVEDGITVKGTGGDFGYFELPDSLHLDGMGPYTSAVEITTASAFAAHSIDLIPLPSGGGHNMACVGAICDQAFLNVLFQGYAGDSLVAMLGWWTGSQPSTFFFPEPFSGLTKLRVSMLFNDNCTEQPCAHMNIDNVTLFPADTLQQVPLPAALPLFAGGVLALGAGGVWRNRGRRGRNRVPRADPRNEGTPASDGGRPS